MSARLHSSLSGRSNFNGNHTMFNEANIIPMEHSVLHSVSLKLRVCWTTETEPISSLLTLPSHLPSMPRLTPAPPLPRRSSSASWQAKTHETQAASSDASPAFATIRRLDQVEMFMFLIGVPNSPAYEYGLPCPCSTRHKCICVGVSKVHL